MLSLFISAILASGAWGTPKPVEPTTKTLVFGVYALEKPSVLYSEHIAFVESVERQLNQRGFNVHLELKVAPSYEKGIESFIDHQFDVVELGAASYVHVREKDPQVKIIAVSKEGGLGKHFPGVFITTRESKIRSVKDLRGKSFAFGDEESTIGRYLSQAELVKAGLTHHSLGHTEYLGRHDKVAAAVLAGSFEAGVINIHVFEKYKDKGLIAFGRFDNMSRPWLASSKMDPKLFEAIKDVFINISDKEALHNMKVSGFAEARPSEFDFVRTGMKQAKRF